MARKAKQAARPARLDEPTTWRLQHGAVSEPQRIADPETGTPVAVRRHEWRAETFGLPECRLEELQVQARGESAEVIHGVFAGRQGAARNIVVANAAAALWIAGRAPDLRSATEMAQQALDSGRTSRLLADLVQTTARLKTA